MGQFHLVSCWKSLPNQNIIQLIAKSLPCSLLLAQKFGEEETLAYISPARC